MMFVFLVLIVIIVILIILSIMAPKYYEVSRSITIDKQLPVVFEYLKYIKNQDHWSPWKRKDLNMRQEFFGTDGEIGFIAKWKGNSDVGIGEQEITRIINNDRIESKLRFFKPWKSESIAFLDVKDVGKMQTKVSWGFAGNNKFPSDIFMLFYNMDKAV